MLPSKLNLYSLLHRLRHIQLFEPNNINSWCLEIYNSAVLLFVFSLAQEPFTEKIKIFKLASYMACNWLIKSNVLVAFLILGSAAEHLTKTYTGTCASIGYANKCCPPGRDCQASDGNCTCNVSCHSPEKCCKDVFCHRSTCIQHQLLTNYLCIFLTINKKYTQIICLCIFLIDGVFGLLQYLCS